MGCVSSPSGIRAEFTTSGVLRRLDVGDRSLLMYPADELEAGLANLYLRIRGDAGAESVPMTGPGTGSTVQAAQRPLEAWTSAHRSARKR